VRSKKGEAFYNSTRKSDPKRSPKGKEMKNSITDGRTKKNEGKQKRK